MRWGDWSETSAAIRDASKDGVIRGATLETFGIPRRTVYQRCLPGGPWRRLLPGIILLSPGEPNERQRLEAALLRGGQSSLITGLWAAKLHGLRRIPEPGVVHILVPHYREITSTGFVLVERTTRMPSASTRDRLPVAPVARAVLDAARRIRAFDVIRALLAEAVQRRRCSPAELSHELERGSQRGSALARRALLEIAGGARSVAEADAWQLWRRAGLPAAQWNVAITDEHGRYVATPDAWCADVGLAWEIDSQEFHFDPTGYAKTLERNARYASAGIVLLQTLPSRLRSDPDGVLRELRAAYQAAARREPPRVQAAA